jgi:hypothetical protein
MMVHICDGGITRREAEDVNANPSCKITSSGAQSSKYKLFIAFVREIYSSAFSEKISHNSPTNLLTILFVAMGKQTRRYHEQSNPNLTHITSWSRNLHLKLDNLVGRNDKIKAENRQPFR